MGRLLAGLAPELSLLVSKSKRRGEGVEAGSPDATNTGAARHQVCRPPRGRVPQGPGHLHASPRAILDTA